MTLDTVFDLASLTKPLATTLALMVLAGRGQLDLATPLGEVLPAPWLPPDKRPLTLGSLLTHRAGLPAWRPFYQEVLAAPPEARPTLLARLAAATPLEYPPDTATLYSDLGFMLLAAVVESLSGETLDRFCRDEIYRPLGLATLWASSPLPQPAPTVVRPPKTENRKPKTALRRHRTGPHCRTPPGGGSARRKRLGRGRGGGPRRSLRPRP